MRYVKRRDRCFTNGIKRESVEVWLNDDNAFFETHRTSL